MKTLKIKAYTIDCLTNMHVGSGADNFGIVDKEIQRDPVDNSPIIHSSSLKGALREFYENCDGVNASLVTRYFGSDKNDQTLKQGSLRFFEGRLLAIPVRGTLSIADYLGTSPKLIESFNQLAAEMQSGSPVINLPTAQNNQAKTEFGETTHVATIQKVGNNIAFFSNELMNTVLKNLPIIARNSLENGQSENLWYEEIIPRGSRFVFFVAVPEDMISAYELELEKEMLEKIVQIGANATVGYGFCKISKF